MMRILGLLILTVIGYLIIRRVTRTYAYFETKRFPAFMLLPKKVDEIGIPVFTFHSVGSPDTPDSISPKDFDKQMRYLVDNGYRALSADELCEFMVYGKRKSDKCVVITFDDGRATLWTVAYPILKKHGLRATGFVVPSTMQADGVRKKIDDYESRLPPREIFEVDLSNNPTITWEEARHLHASGLVDIQSHTWDHTRIYCKQEIVDFIHPEFNFGFSCYAVPVIRYSGRDRKHFKPPLGTPIYHSCSRMEAGRRFFDDEMLREACVDYVEKRGGVNYFKRNDWREALLKFVNDYRNENDLTESYESELQQHSEIRSNLRKSKESIEHHIPNHSVTHLCFPWHRYSALAMRTALDSGYISSFIDVNPQKLHPHRNDPYRIQKSLPINEHGDDPYKITRIDARDNSILSLPGRGRLSYGRRVAARLFSFPKLKRR